MQWSNEHAVGIPAIDEQHRKLATLISSLEQSVGMRQDRDRVHSDVVILAKYNRAHFAVEETLMRAHGYPASEAHLSEHLQFMQALADLERQSAVKLVNVELVALIRAWEEEHVMVSDRLLADHVSTTGRAGRPLPRTSGRPGTDSMDFDRE